MAVFVSVGFSGAVLAAEGLLGALFLLADALFVVADLSDELLVGVTDALLAGATAEMFVVAGATEVMFVVAVVSLEGMLLAVEVMTSAGPHESCAGNFVVWFCSFSICVSVGVRTTVSQAAV